MPRRLPPYARELSVRLQGDLMRWPGTSGDGRHATLWLAVGTGAWSWAQVHVATRLLTLLPPGEDPRQFDWSLLRDHPPVLIHRCGQVSDNEVYRLAAALLRAGVDRVLDLDTLALHRRRAADAA